MNSNLFRDWFFERLIWVLKSGEWEIRIKDFKNSKSKKENNLLGLIDPHTDKEGGFIYLDKTGGTPRILVHELGHVVLGDILDNEATSRKKTSSQISKWTENQVLNFERVFYGCLTSKQRSVLKIFIDRAKIAYQPLSDEDE